MLHGQTIYNAVGPGGFQARNNDKPVAVVTGVRIGVNSESAYYQHDDNGGAGDRSVRKKRKHKAKDKQGDTTLGFLSDSSEQPKLIEGLSNPALSKSHLMYQGQHPNSGLAPHLKKASIEYEKLVQQAQRKVVNGGDEVFGSNYIYNLRPLKDIIVNTIQQ